MRASAAVYPRVCGGTNGAERPITQADGLSPRVRGNLPLDVVCVRDDGSIPACAGEPVLATGVQYKGGVYPRVCGGTVG